VGRRNVSGVVARRTGEVPQAESTEGWNGGGKVGTRRRPGGGGKGGSAVVRVGGDPAGGAVALPSLITPFRPTMQPDDRPSFRWRRQSGFAALAEGTAFPDFQHNEPAGWLGTRWESKRVLHSRVRAGTRGRELPHVK